MTEKNQRKSNGRGGARKGAGRKRGSANTKTREIADKAAADGITPLEVMLRAMRALVDEADAVVRQQVAEGATQIAYPHGLLEDAAAIAKDAAPYIHPKLAAIEHTGKGGGPVQFAKIERVIVRPGA
jgi:hypothetical protein